MKVLVACEYSGRVRDAFTALGHDATSCDILPTESEGKHYQGDVMDIINDGWDLMVAHPPCTYLSYAGTRHWNNPGRAELRDESMKFFMQMINAPIPHICVENPQGYPNTIYRKPDQIINPYQFGDAFKKRTCLWLKNLPKLWWWNDPYGMFAVTGVPKPPPLRIQEHNGKIINWCDGVVRNPYERARTFQGIANAMASQWGGANV